jgi:tetratricopeptide (TPR) repeat protein
LDMKIHPNKAIQSVKLKGENEHINRIELEPDTPNDVILPGTSGGPVLDKEKGSIIGVVVRTHEDVITANLNPGYAFGWNDLPADWKEVHRLFAHEKTNNDNTPVPVFGVPYVQNPFFTGREDILEKLHKAFQQKATGNTIQVLDGLGGIGKTQTAVEYAYRHRENYEAIFWVKANSELEIQSGLLDIADKLNLPEKYSQDANEAVKAVIKWLKDNSGWLLIFDNADNPKIIKGYIPVGATGHILLTSRAQVFQELGVVKPLEIIKLTPPEAREFLFKRTGRENIDNDEKKAAEDLAKELDYLPLALEQAGAYITVKKVLFQQYLTSYKKRRLKLLEEQRPVSGDYPTSVATTWELNFEEVKKESEAAADILSFSALLSPDGIPLELISGGASHLGTALSKAVKQAERDPLVVNTLLESLTRYSLIRIDIPSRTYSIHRLVQEVVKERTGKPGCRIWAVRIIKCLNELFPGVEFGNWALCERMLPQTRAVMVFVEEYGFESEEVAWLYNQTGGYLDERARYLEAEPLHQRCLAIREKILGVEHPNVALSLNNLAALYFTQGKYEKAEPMFKRCLAIREKILGVYHSDLALSLNNLAVLYNTQGKYEAAEPLFKRSLAIYEKARGVEHPNTASILNNLAELYRAQGKYEESEPLYQRCLAIWEKVLGANHPDVALSLNNLAILYMNQGKYEAAEPLIMRSLSIREKTLGAEHPDVAMSLNNLAGLYHELGKYKEVEFLYTRSLAIYEKVLGVKHPDVVTIVNNLAAFYKEQGKNKKAEELLKRFKQAG